MEAVREIIRRYGAREGEGEGEEMVREVGEGEVRDFGALLVQESDMWVLVRSLPGCGSKTSQYVILFVGSMTHELTM